MPQISIIHTSGRNSLGCCRRTVAIVDLMRERMPAAVIVLVGILPRHKMNHHGPLVWPNMYSEV